SWQMAVALIPGMAAREVAVGALGTVYAISGQIGEGSLATALARQWSLASALAFLAWYVFAPQCLSTLAVVRRETGGWLWPSVMFGYMLALAYIAAFIVFRTASAFGA
ncbi:MAG: ferrous iron transporter B, partial [Rhizobiales bacterium]|nr:ferrous iron transporter B [Hyphomicrobiales bacterium]